VRVFGLRRRVPTLATMAHSKRRAGRWVAQPGGYRAFYPAAVPPDPAIDVHRLRGLLDAAHAEIGELGDWTAGPSEAETLGRLVRAEAIASCAIEGIQATVEELLGAARGGGATSTSAIAVLRYEDALDLGRSRVRSGALDVELVLDLHACIVGAPQGLRQRQNFVGEPGTTDIAEAIFVPPPPSAVRNSIENLLTWQASAVEVDPLVVCAVAHAQLLTIHPFEDGNGRLARVISQLDLVRKRVVDGPFIPLSASLGRKRAEYYAALTDLRATGNWEEWIGFFIARLTEAARNATSVLKSEDRVVAADDLLSWLKAARSSSAAQVTGIHGEQRSEA
jgi:Fic family protein